MAQVEGFWGIYELEHPGEGHRRGAAARQIYYYSPPRIGQIRKGNPTRTLYSNARER